ncbi:MAG: hypothetical protein E6Q67_05610 [Roseateles sp.]|nr:MAG: hypothetical protein E6Q67_05610 [Roseateles sp.]
MQALESACLSLTEFHQRSGFADPRKTLKPRRKDITSALKTVFWAFSLQARTGLATAYALERCFEPEAFGQDDKGDRYHRNKWSGYLAGRNQPEKVLAAVEAKCPGANDCLSNPLWAALTDRPLTRLQLEALIMPLEPGIQSLVRRRGPSPHPAHPQGSRIDHRLAEALERRASLDALAAAVILLRIAHAEGATALAFQWGRHVLRIMVMLSELLHEGGIARPLLELIEERVLRLARHDGAQPGFPRGTFAEIARHYASAMRRIDGKPFESMSQTERQAARQSRLGFRAGFDYFYAFNPIRVLADFGAGALGEQVLATPDAWLHTWALNMLAMGGHRDPPPALVRAGEDLWARQEGATSQSKQSGESLSSGYQP